MIVVPMLNTRCLSVVVLLLTAGSGVTRPGGLGREGVLRPDRPNVAKKAGDVSVRGRGVNPLETREGRAEALRSIRMTRQRFQLPPEMTDWEGILRQPGRSYPEQITRAYYFGLASSPTAAFRALIEGTLQRDEAAPVYARRLELIGLTLRPTPDAGGDPLLGDVVAAVRSWREADRLDAAGGLFASAWPLLARRALEQVRLGRLSAEIAARFALAVPERPLVPLLVVALGRGSATARDYWSLSDVCSPDDDLARDAFRRLYEETEPRADELRPFYQALAEIARVDGGVMARRLSEEVDSRLARLQQLPGARGLDGASLKFLAGVRGKSTEADLARLTDAKRFASLELSLAAPPRRIGFGR